MSFFSPTVLVTGAAGGGQGATGARVARLLRTAGFFVRALVHREDERSERLRTEGFQVVVADLLDWTAVRDAMDGARRAFFNYPVQEGLLQAIVIFAASAKECGVERVVALSHLNAGPEAPSPRTREHGLAEHILDWASVGAIHLRAAVFFENIQRHAASGGAKACIRLPFDDGSVPVPLIAGEDVARIAAALLIRDQPPTESRVLATGQVLSAGDMAEQLSSTLRRDVVFAPVSDATWRAEVWERLGPENPFVIAHLSALWKTFQLTARGPNPFRVSTDLFRSLLDREPQKLADFATARADTFFDPDTTTATA